MSNRFRLPEDWQLNKLTRPLEERIGWYLPFMGIPDLWKECQGEDVTVAILDTGYTPVKDLPKETKVIHAADFTKSAFGVADRVGHGTWCAGAIGALKGNDEGVPGIAPLCKLLCGKVLGDNGSGTDDTIEAGFVWAMQNGADIISMSLGGPQMSDRLHRLFKEFTSQPGKFVVAAAGNDGHANNRDTVNYPAKWLECICVGAIGNDGNITEFSSNGPRVDIFAPGKDMVGLAPDGTYAVMSGTSMATPAVAGIMALMLGKQKKMGSASPTLTTEQMRSKLKSTARLSGVIGLIDPAKLIGSVIPVPTKPDPGTPVILPPPTPVGGWSMPINGGILTYTPTK